MPLPRGSAGLDDCQFLESFYSCDLSPSSFKHSDHLRLAWLQVHQKPLDDALRSVREGIKQFAAHHGVSHIYHETITTAWVMLLATHDEDSFEEFLSQNESRLKIELLHNFWSPDVLQSETARREWVTPDRKPLPVIRSSSN